MSEEEQRNKRPDKEIKIMKEEEITKKNLEILKTNNRESFWREKKLFLQ